MAGEKTSQASELDTLAFDLFRTAVATLPAARAGEAVAVDAYRKADIFLAVREKMRSGGLKAAKPEGPALADVHCPNLPRLSPHNLVSQKWGNLNRVAQIQKWLDANPTPEKDPEDLLHRLGREFPDLRWSIPEVNVARAVFPTYVTN